MGRCELYVASAESSAEYGEDTARAGLRLVVRYINKVRAENVDMTSQGKWSRYKRACCRLIIKSSLATAKCGRNGLG